MSSNAEYDAVTSSASTHAVVSDIASDSSAVCTNTTKSVMRIGIGIDTHALASGYKLVLGGVHIKHNCGLVGHSDADVLCHAIMDALLGAARIVGAHDIGELFPDTNPSYKGASSIELLAKVGAILCDNSMRVCDLDSVIIAQRPRLSIYREAMRTNIAAALGIQIGQVGLKATTTEHLGPEGREEGITAHCVALVESE